MDSPTQPKRVRLSSHPHLHSGDDDDHIVFSPDGKFEKIFVLRRAAGADVPIKVSFSRGEIPREVASRTLSENGLPELQCYLQPTMKFICAIMKFDMAVASFRTTMQRAVTIEVDPFRDVPVDIWSQIFTLLPLVDRVRCERVCKRLAKLCNDAWSIEKTLDATECPSGFCGTRAENEILKFCTRTGPNLRSLKLSDKLKLCWIVNFRAIAKRCPNIECVTFRVTKFGRYTPHYPAPRELCFDAFVGLKVLRMETELKAVMDADYVPAPIGLFLTVPKSVQVLTGLGTNVDTEFPSHEQFERFFAERPQLKEVRLGPTYWRGVGQPKIFRVITDRCPHLKKLWAHTCLNCDGFESLVGMLEINVSCSPLSDAQIVAFCNANPQLEILCFPSGIALSALSATGWSAVAGLKKLRELVGEAGQLTVTGDMNAVLQKLVANSGASLRRLVFCSVRPGYFRVSTATIHALGDSCPLLRRLEFLVSSESATPASIRYLIDHIVGNAAWKGSADFLEITLNVAVANDQSAAFQAFVQLASPAAFLPARVQLTVDRFCV